MNKYINSGLKIIAYFFVFLTLFFIIKSFLFRSVESNVENFRSLYFLNFWNMINLGFLNSKFFFSFVLVFPLFASLGYLLLYISLKMFGFQYQNFSYVKEITIFLGFLYFFFFILILIDFIYYIEIHKLYFNVTDEEMHLLLKKK